MGEIFKKHLNSNNSKTNAVMKKISGITPINNPSDYNSYKNKISTAIKDSESKRIAEDKKKTEGFLSDGILGDTFDILSVGQFATTGFFEGILKKTGVLKDDKKESILGDTGSGIQERKSNIDLLKKVGQETGRGGLLTGQYESNTSVWKNFVRELPVTAIGLVGDLFLDPTIIGSKLKLFKGIKDAGVQGVKGATMALRQNIPAIEKAYQTISKSEGLAFLQRQLLVRGGQSEAMKKLDVQRLIDEDMAAAKNSRMVTPVIETGKALQKRMRQIREGGITTRKDLENIVKDIGDEIDNAGNSIVEQERRIQQLRGEDPDFKLEHLLDPETYKKNKGKYLPKIYESKIEEKRKGSVFGKLFMRSSDMSVPGGQFKRREYFGDKILKGNLKKNGVYESEFDDFFKLNKADKLSVLAKAQNPDLPKFGKNPGKLSDKEVIETQAKIKTLSNLNKPLEDTRLKIYNILQNSLNDTQREMIKKIKLPDISKELPLEKMFRVTKDGITSSLSNIPKRKVAEKVYRKYIKAISEKLPEININDTLDIKVEKAFVSMLEDKIDNSIEVSRRKLDKLVEKRQKRKGELEQFEGFKKMEKMAREIRKAVKGNDNVLKFDDFNFQSNSKNMADLLTQRVRKELVEVEEIGLKAGKGMSDLDKAKIRLKFFNDLYEEGAVSSFRNDAKGLSHQLPDSPLLGAAKGGWVNRADAELIASKFFKETSKITKIYNNLLSTWKLMKVFNLATMSRNMLSGFLALNPLGGLPVWRVDIYRRAMKGFGRENDVLWNNFQKVGGGISNQSSAEFMNRAEELYLSNTELAKGIKSFFPTLKKFKQKAADFYGNQDVYMKFANFIKGKEDGLSDLQAMKRANFYMIDYSEVPGAIEFLRKSPLGVPFITFTYGVSKPLAKTLIDNPEKLSAFYKTIRAIQSLNPYGETEEEMNRLENALPNDLKGVRAMKMPYKDKNGNYVYIDLRYILPFNILETDVDSDNNMLSKMGIPEAIQSSNPIYTIIADFQRNKSSFTKKEIVPAGATRWEAYMAATDYIQKQALPNWSPTIPTRVNGKTQFGGYAVQKIIDTIEKRPAGKTGEPRAMGETIADIVFGLKNVPVNVAVEEKFRALEKKSKIKDISTQIFKIKVRKTLTTEEKAKEIKRLREKIKQIRDK